MATSKPRVTVTLTPEMHELLRELADLNGESLSAVISGLLEAVGPTVAHVVEAGRRFMALSAEMQEQVGRTFVQAEATVSATARDLEATLFAALEGAEPAPQPEPDPRAVTRGSRPPLQSHPLDESGSEK